MKKIWFLNQRQSEIADILKGILNKLYPKTYIRYLYFEKEYDSEINSWFQISFWVKKEDIRLQITFADRWKYMNEDVSGTIELFIYRRLIYRKLIDFDCGINKL